MSPQREKASGGTNEVGAPDSGLWSDGLVLTPRVKDLFPVLGPVLTARPSQGCSNRGARQERRDISHGQQTCARRWSNKLLQPTRAAEPFGKREATRCDPRG